MGDHAEVARVVEALAREVERRDEQGPGVGHDVLGVMLRGARAVARHPRAHADQLLLQATEPPLPATGPARQQHVHFHAASHGRRHLGEHFGVVATEDGEPETAAGATDDAKHRGSPFDRLDHDAVRCHDFFGDSQDTEARPRVPSPTSASVTSSIETWGGRVVR